MSQDQTHIDPLRRLIDELRRSLELIQFTPPVPIQSAHAKVADAILYLISDLVGLGIDHEGAADGVFTFTPAHHRERAAMVRRVAEKLERAIPVLANPDTVWPGMQYDGGKDISWYACFCTLIEDARRETDWTRQHEMKARLHGMLDEYLPGSRGPGSVGFDGRCDLEVVSKECKERMIPGLAAYVASHPVPVEALKALIQELKKISPTDAVLTGGNEIKPTTPPQGIAYRLVGELFGYDWTTVRDHLNRSPA